MTTAMVNAETEAIIGSQRHDVLIVGGGHNGLSAACYLAAAGKKVLLFEALDKVGGMASSGYLLSRAPRHLVHPCALDMMSMRVHPQVPLELELERHGELVTAGQVAPHSLTRIAQAPSNAHGAAPVKVDMALCGQISVKRFEDQRADGLDLRKTCLLIGTAEAVLENFAASARGEVPTLPYLTIAAPSAVDPSQAPAGQDTVYLYPPAMPVKPREGWDALRDRITQQIIDHASAYVDGLKECEIARRMEAPPDFSQRLNTVNGCVVHINTSSLRSNTLRPAYGLGGATLPVAGLYFGGAGIHPGGGVNGIPGRIAAFRVQRFLGKSSPTGTRNALRRRVHAGVP